MYENKYSQSNELNKLANEIYQNNLRAGWWPFDDDGLPAPEKRNKGEIIALIHSEISEALEGVRKNKQDDHLPHRKSEEVELADAVVRILDYAGAFNLDIGGALAEKTLYNQKRSDHKLENRAKEGGKRF